MRLLVVVIFFGAVSFFSFVGGLYVAFTYQNQLQFFGQGGILLAIFTPIGATVTLLKFILDWYKEPSLKYGKLSTNNEPACYLQIEKKKKGKAKDCEGFVTVEETSVTHAASVWSLDNRRVIDIGGHLDIRLFRLVGKDKIAFPVAHYERGFIENIQSLDDIRKRKLTLEIYSVNASTPKPYIATIDEIMEKINL